MVIDAIDLFAGGGGASLGLEAAGLRVVGAYERDARACRAHRAILPDVPVHQADLDEIDPGDLPEAPIWWASPPCQPGSTAGLRLGCRDPRDGYPALLRLVRARRPRWLLIENVPGFTQHASKAGCSTFWPRPEQCPACYLAAIMRELDALFPVVQMRILDAADYGVPQHRERLITVCGPTRIEWPVPTHGPGRPQPWVAAGTCIDWSSVPGFESAARLFAPAGRPHGAGRDKERTYRDVTDEPAATVCGDTGTGAMFLAIEHGGTSKGYLHRDVADPGPTVGTASDLRLTYTGSRHAARALDEPSPTMTASRDLYLSVGGPNARGGQGPSISDPASDPAPTVRTHADCYLVAAESGEGRPRDLADPSPTVSGKGTTQLVGSDYRRLRTLTVRERAALQSLPWVPELTGRIVGNAVPPPLAAVVAQAVIAAAEGDGWL